MDHLNYEAWNKCDVMVSSWMLRTLSESIARSVMYTNSAKEIWDDLANRISRADPHRIYDLHDEINNLRQGSLSIMEYYTNCRSLYGMR